jgi:general secretion pathway protein E
MAATAGNHVPLADHISREFLLHHRVCPRAISDDGKLIVAAPPDALLSDSLDDLVEAYGRDVAIEATPLDQVERLIERMCVDAGRSLELALPNDGPDADGGATDVRDLATQPPVVRYVNLLVRDAYDAGASDIHLEATRSGLTARFRLDGVLSPATDPPNQLGQAVVSRIKLLAELDIAERRRPQDGRIRVRLDSRELDLRVSTVPTAFGESVVLRLLDQGGRPVALEELGMAPSLLVSMGSLAARPHGLVLVTGPTGSGKTTTLYAALQRRDAGAEKIITVEDPIEYQSPGITQVPVHRQSGVTFASALRSILRQDPDVVMIGEMRDPETAEIGIQAAMTGHLVLSTLHTNDATSAVPRLVDLGIPSYLLAATLEGVLAQRLIRRMCDRCRVAYRPSSDTLALLGASLEGRVARELSRGAGCAECRGTGFRGRVGIFEVMVVNDDLRDAVARNAPRAELRQVASATGMRSLEADGLDKVAAGLTTIEEVLRVVRS